MNAPAFSLEKQEENIIWYPQAGSQYLYMSCPIWEVLFGGTRGPGKASWNEAPVMTPFGPRKMKDIKVGQRVSNPDGYTSKVIGVYPQGKVQLFDVKFSDGTETKVSGDHIWHYWFASRGKGVKNEGFLATTLQLKEHIELNKKLRGNNLPLIPLTKPVKMQSSFRKHKSEIDPYLLGLILGDSCITTKCVSVTTEDQEIVDCLKKFGFYPSWNHKNNNDYRVPSDHSVVNDLQRMKLIGTRSHTKFIPLEFKHGSILTRLALLQGLMDSDGYVSEDGYLEYTSVSFKLIEDVRFLVESLGGWATLTCNEAGYTNQKGIYIKCKDAYSLYIQFPNKEDLFRLTRKKKRCQGRNYKFDLFRKIVSIEEAEIDYATCIKVDNPNGLYLTDNFIVTHNTDALIMDFLQDVGVGYGASWRGVLFRKTFPQLQDVIAKTKKWIPRIFPDAKYDGSQHVWKFPDGEELLLRYMRRPEDYWEYHGHEYPFIGWEELTSWIDEKCYNMMKACNRSSDAKVPRKYRATTNPYGIGHSWVKARFIDPAPPCVPVTDKQGKKRIYIHGDLRENRILMKADPDYYPTLMSLTEDDENLRKAWVYGSWDIQAGGALADVWNKKKHVLQPFKIPSSWFVDRSFDWGSSKPFSVCWWAESDGTQVELANGATRTFPAGTLFLIAEWYGWNGRPDVGTKMLATEIARGIVEIEEEYPFIVNPGPADTSIFDTENGVCIASDMGRIGVDWTKADKRPGSRINGLEKIRELLSASTKFPMEDPGIFIFSTCRNWIRTVPVLPRDEKKIDDVDTDTEDHCYDATRYRCQNPEPFLPTGETNWK